MKNKIFTFSLLSIISFSALAADLDFKVVDSEKIDKQPVYNEVIQLLTKEEKEKNLQEKIVLLKADIEKWKKYQNELITLKSEYEQAFKENEVKITAFNKEIEELKTQLKESDDKSIIKENKKIDVKKTDDNKKQITTIGKPLDKKLFDHKKDPVSAEIEKTKIALEEESRIAALAAEKAKRDSEIKLNEEKIAKEKEIANINKEKEKEKEKIIAAQKSVVKPEISKKENEKILVINKKESDKPFVTVVVENSVKENNKIEDKLTAPVNGTALDVKEKVIVKNEIKVDKLENNVPTKTIDEQKKEIAVSKEQLANTSKKIDTLTTKIVKSTDEITSKSEEIDIGTKLLADDSIKDEIVEFNLKNGKKIKLMKHTVFPGESLSGIVNKTFPVNYTAKYTEIEFRINTIKKLNKDLVNQDQIKAGQVIYIPFFKL